MPITIDSFPKLNNKIFSKIGFTGISNRYSYHDNGVICLLEAENTESSNSKTTVVKLTDPVSKWHPETYNLIIGISGTINAPMHLFGINGLASKNGAQIGIAIIWMSKDSCIRGITPIADFENQSNSLDYDGEVSFNAHTLRGTLVLRTVLYLKKAGTVVKEEQHLANVSGTILGVLDETRIIIDGNGSVFPVVEKADKTMPLWWVECNWEDPTEDLLIGENFCLYLNTAHTDYSSLNLNNGLNQAPLFKDIIASAIGILITEVLSNDAYKSQTISGAGLAPGTISAAVNYFIKVYDIDTGMVNHQGALSKALRKQLMSRF